MTETKKIFIAFSLIGLSACSIFLGEPSERVVKFDDFELCTKLADKTFNYNAEWAWAISDEIKKRQLDKVERCQDAYTNRMKAIMTNIKATPVNFTDAINNKTSATM